MKDEIQEIIDLINQAVSKSAELLSDAKFNDSDKAIESIAKLCDSAKFFKSEI
jgi:hypothetical protein